MDQKDQVMWVHQLWDPLDKLDDSPLHSRREGIKVAAYCRVSSETNEVSVSLDSQVSYYTHFISNRDNWTFVGIYFDNLVTGRKASLRRGFTRMLRHCEEHKIDLILVKNISRFSRNTQELIEVIERLKKLKITVYFETENIESTRDDTTYLLKTYAGIAQEEIEAISNSVEWAHERNMLKGKAILGPLYGYEQKRINKEKIITVNEEQAQVVRNIYQMYLDGMTFNGIAVELSKRNIKTYHGKSLWSSGQIRAVLSNVSYTGKVLTRKTTRDLMTNKHRSSQGIRDQYLIGNHHPQIVDTITFDAVQEKLVSTERNKFPASSTPNHLLKRIKCGNCDYSYQRTKIKPKIEYRCVSSIRNRSLCSAPRLSEDLIIRMILKAFAERFDLKDTGIINTLRRMLIKINRNDHFEFHRLRAITQIQMAKTLIGVKYTDDDIKKMEEDYRYFEEQLVKIEDDRKYRILAIQWLETVEDFDKFEAQATVEYMRAWIMEMVVFSREDYMIRWIDGNEIEIGNCIRIEPKREEPSTENESSCEGIFDVEKNTAVSKENQIIASKKGGDIRDEEEKQMLQKRLDPIIMVKNIEKQLSASVIMQTSLPVLREEKLNVAAYIRVSTEHEQQTLSLKMQYSYFLYLILKNPQYTLVDIYMDDGKSGRTTEGRPAFKRMIEDCKAGRIDLIITKSLSRFARNTVDTLTYLNMLKSLDPPTDVWFERENLRALDTKSNVLINLLSALGQEESVNIGEAIAWGKRSLAKRGIVRPARLGYGYQKGENGEWQINEEQAKIVNRIYNEYESGMKINDIIRSLAAESIPSPGGTDKWSPTSILSILSSEKYRGNYLFQRFHAGTSLEQKRVKNSGELPMYLIENHHEGIVDNEKWERVQLLMMRNRQEKEAKREKFPKDHGKNDSFTKKFYCNECGSLFGYARAMQKQKKIHEFRWWKCYGSKDCKCDGKYVKQEYLEDNFSQLLMHVRFDLNFEKEVNSFVELLQITEAESKLINELEHEKEELNQKLYKAVRDEIGKNGKDAKLVEHLTEEIMKLREKLNVFYEREEQIEDIEKEIVALRKALESYNNQGKDDIGFYKSAPEFQKELFDRFIEKGTVTKEGKITYTFTSGFEWGPPLDYSSFQERDRRIKAAERAAVKAEYLRGPEVKALIRYCSEPKTLTEMIEFLGKFASKTAFRRNILYPLIDGGKIKRTIPDKPGSKFQKYYSVKK